MRTALVMIDIQNDYFPGGRMELVGSEVAAHSAANLLRTFRQAGWPVFHVKQISIRNGSTFFLPGNAALEGQVADEVLSLFSKGKREARSRYRLFVADGVAQGKREDLGGGRRISKVLQEELGNESYDERVLGSGEFVEDCGCGASSKRNSLGQRK